MLIVLRCSGHVINIATQKVLKTYSAAPHYTPNTFEDIDQSDERDLIGLIRAVAVKAKSSSIRQTVFKKVQAQDQKHLKKLLLDMPVRWASTYVMLDRAEMLKMVLCLSYN